MKPLIQKLVETPGPSGFETQIRDVIQKEITSLDVNGRVDSLGNLIVAWGELKPGGLKIILSAHMDEIGLMATHIDAGGFIRFTTLGGVRPVNCLGGRVRFMSGVTGVIGSERLADGSRTLTFEQMYIDVGASGVKDCPVRVGDVAAFERPFVDLGKRLVAKAMDDRIGVAVLVETLRELVQHKIESPHQVFFLFSVQEEVGVRGATAAAYGVDPDLGLAIDVTQTGDTPNAARMQVALGQGPAIKLRDSGLLADPRVVRWMVQTAEKSHLPYQREILERGGTDAEAIQLTRSGVPAGCLSIPCRYIHSPSEMVDTGDVENSVRLLVGLLQESIDLEVMI
jgi:tetrahedral aminopeptidase